MIPAPAGRFILAAALASAAGAAGAQICSPYPYCLVAGPQETSPNNPGVNTAQQRGAVIAPLLSISNIVGASLRGVPGGGAPGGLSLQGSPETGLAGAVQGSRWNAWAAYANTGVSYSWTPLDSGGHVHSVMLGADYRVAERWIAGLSLAADDTSIATRYNNGNITGNGYNLAPYVGWQISERWSLDAAAGIGRASTSHVDNVALTTGSADSSRRFGAVNLNYSRWLGRWELAAKGTLIDAREKKEAFTLSNGTAIAESTTRLGQLRLGGQVGYLAANGINPYIALAYVSDYRRDAQAPIAGQPLPANDRAGWMVAVGANLFSKGPLSGGLRWQTERRSEQKQDLLLVNLAIRF
jgi:hypothetical protein